MFRPGRSMDLRLGRRVGESVPAVEGAVRTAGAVPVAAAGVGVGAVGIDVVVDGVVGEVGLGDGAVIRATGDWGGDRARFAALFDVRGVDCEGRGDMGC